MFTYSFIPKICVKFRSGFLALRFIIFSFQFLAKIDLRNDIVRDAIMLTEYGPYPVAIVPKPLAHLLWTTGCPHLHLTCPLASDTFLLLI